MSRKPKREGEKPSISNNDGHVDEENGDWVVKESKTKKPGRLYYFNTKTGECQWTPPSSISPTTEDQRSRSANKSSKNKTKKTSCGDFNSCSSNTTAPIITSCSSGSKRKAHASDTEAEIADDKSIDLGRQFKKKRIDVNPVSFEFRSNSTIRSTRSGKSVNVNNFSFKLHPALDNSGIFATNESTAMDVSFSSIEDEAMPPAAMLTGLELESAVEFMEVDEIVQEVNYFRKDQATNIQQALAPVQTDLGGDWDTVLQRTGMCNDLVLVVDTNVLLSDLRFVKDLVDVSIVVPYVVIQELDCLKEDRYSVLKRKQSSLSNSARTAIGWIYDQLTKTETKDVFFQPSQADRMIIPNLEVICNDDRVLHCAMDVAQRRNATGSNTLTVLCTNDKNLLNKGRINGLRCASAKEFQTFLDSLREASSSSELCEPEHETPAASQPSTASTFTSTVPAPVPLVSSQSDFDNANGTTVPSDSDKDYSEIDTILNSCKLLLIIVVETEMKSALGQEWKEIVKIKPPWKTLDELLDILMHHWMAVFQWIFTDAKSTKEILRKLQADMRNMALFGVAHVLPTGLLPRIHHLLKNIRRRNSAYRGQLDSLMAMIQRSHVDGNTRDSAGT